MIFFGRKECRDSSPGFDAAFPSVAFISDARVYFPWLFGDWLIPGARE